MNFCSNCGQKVSLQPVEGDERPRHVCNSCNTIHYQNPKIVTGCVPIFGNKVMLCRRAIEPRRGLWNLPGGFMENGETAQQGAQREVLEEAGIKVDIIDLHAIFNIPQINQVYIIYLAAMPDLNYANGIETMETKMFEEKDIPWDEIAFSSSTFSLKKYFEDRKAGVRQVHLGVRK